MKKYKLKISGFTLIELLVVTTIVGILSAIGVPTYSDYNDKAHQAKSYGFQMQIEKIVLLDCINNGYSCGPNLVPNWAFSLGDDGTWPATPNYEITQYRLRHIPESGGGPNYITVPFTEPLEPFTTYRVDVAARDIIRNGGQMYGPGLVGFSMVGSNIGEHARIPEGDFGSICDVFRTPATPNVRLFTSAPSSVTFDEISVRKVEGGADVNGNDDCNLSTEIYLDSDS